MSFDFGQVSVINRVKLPTYNKCLAKLLQDLKGIVVIVKQMIRHRETNP